MNFLYFAFTLFCLLASADIGHRFDARQYAPGFRTTFMLITVSAGLGMLTWGVYGVIQLRWWEVLGAFILASFLGNVARNCLANSLWINLWAMALAITGVVLMLLQMLG